MYFYKFINHKNVKPMNILMNIKKNKNIYFIKIFFLLLTISTISACITEYKKKTPRNEIVLELPLIKIGYGRVVFYGNNTKRFLGTSSVRDVFLNREVIGQSAMKRFFFFVDRIPGEYEVVVGKSDFLTDPKSYRSVSFVLLEGQTRYVKLSPSRTKGGVKTFLDRDAYHPRLIDPQEGIREIQFLTYIGNIPLKQ